MNKIHRRLLSGASFAVIAIAVPQYAGAAALTCAKIGYSGPFSIKTTATALADIDCTASPVTAATNTVVVLRGEIHRTAGSGDVTITAINSGNIEVHANAHATKFAFADAEGTILSANAAGASVAFVDFVNKGIYDVTASAVQDGFNPTTHEAIAVAVGMVEEAVNATSKATAAFSNAAGAVFHVEAKAESNWDAEA